MVPLPTAEWWLLWVVVVFCCWPALLGWLLVVVVACFAGLFLLPLVVALLLWNFTKVERRVRHLKLEASLRSSTHVQSEPAPNQLNLVSR